MTLGTNLDTAWSRAAEQRMRAAYGMSAEPESLVAPLRPFFADADVVLLNVETAIGVGPAKSKCPDPPPGTARRGRGPRERRTCYAFRAPPSAAAALRSIGGPNAVVVGNVANNHARDAGGVGLDSTVALLSRARVLVTGRDTLATPVVLPGGATLAVLGFYTSTETPDVRDLGALRRHVARAVRLYGTVIVTAHLGAEGASAQRTGDSTEYFLSTRIDRGNPVAFASAALESGAALVVNHGPHVLRAAEWRDAGMVLHSLGNLLTYGPFNVSEPMNRGAVACVDIAGGKVAGAALRPTVQIAPGVLLPDRSGRAFALVDSLSALDFPITGVKVDAWGELLRRTP